MLTRYCDKHELDHVLDGGGPGQFWCCPACMTEAFANFTPFIGPTLSPKHAWEAIIEKAEREIWKALPC